MSFHPRIHQRLRVTRLVSFVMSELAKSDDVEYHVLIKLLPVFQGDLKCAVGGFRVVTINMKDWQLSHARHVCRINGGTAGLWGGRETNLVVDDDVNCATGSIAF